MIKFSAIYLPDSGKFQIHMINSLVSLHWAEICRLDNRLSQTTPCRHCSAAGVHASEVSLAGFHSRGLLVAHKSNRLASFATLLPSESIVKHNI